MFGFVLNDVLDYEKDLAAGVLRPICAGELSRHAALAFGSLLLVFACFIAWVIGPGAPLLVLTAVALIAYTPSARRIPLVKGAYVAALCLTPLAYGAVISRTRVPGVTYALDAAFVWGREILMDADEMAGDQLAGMSTMAVILGASFARRLAILLMVISLTCLNVVARGPLGTTAAAFSVGSLVCILAWPAVTESTRINLTRISMLAAALALASS
jgi:4-hydroxybenzoate polyprenyltransferase